MCWCTSVQACTVLCASVHPHSAKSHLHVRKNLKHSSPLLPSAGFVVTMRFRRQTCTIAPWMGRATSTGASCSPLSTSHPSRSWSSRRRWAGHHCLYSVLRDFSGCVHVFSSLLPGVCTSKFTGHILYWISQSYLVFVVMQSVINTPIFALCMDNSPCDVTTVP